MKTTSKLKYVGGRYQTEKQSISPLAKKFPSCVFYARLLLIIARSGLLARQGRYDSQAWINSSYSVIKSLETINVQLEISGMKNVTQQKGPVVFVGNHMSTMETFILPTILQAIKPVTFVVKKELLSYLFFGRVLQTRKPIAVTRTNPRLDFKTVLKEGQKNILNGKSIIVFPQKTRSRKFDPRQMNSIGVKLARSVGVSVIPVAIKTDCWKKGPWIKDFGPIDPSEKAHIAFGESVYVKKGNSSEQARINDFISSMLALWMQQQNH